MTHPSIAALHRALREQTEVGDLDADGDCEIDGYRLRLAPLVDAVLAAGWRPIETAPKDGTRVDLWLSIHASPRSLGMADDFRVPEAWFRDGKWVHVYNYAITELHEPYITHWMPIAGPPPKDQPT